MRPRDRAGLFTFEVGDDQVIDEHHGADGLNKRAYGDDHIQRAPAAIRLVGVNMPRHPQEAGDVHEVE